MAHKSRNVANMGKSSTKQTFNFHARAPLKNRKHFVGSARKLFKINFITTWVNLWNSFSMGIDKLAKWSHQHQRYSDCDHHKFSIFIASARARVRVSWTLAFFSLHKQLENKSTKPFMVSYGHWAGVGQRRGAESERTLELTCRLH